MTLTSDFGLDDWYVAAMKGAVLRQCPSARLIDVTHRIAPGDVLCGSIALERAIESMGKGAVHLAVVDPGVGSARRILIVRIRDAWVVCPDNGLITWAWRRHKGARSHELTWRPHDSSSTFHGRDIMGPVAGMLAALKPLADLARPIDDPVLLDIAPAEAPLKRGVVIHVDRFGNAMTNVPAPLLRDAGELSVVVGETNVGRVRQTYADVAPGQPLALIGSSGLLEIAVRDGSAAASLGLRAGDEVALVGPTTTPAVGAASAAADLVRSSPGTVFLRDLDRKHVWHPFTHMKQWLASDPLVITDAQGMYLIDSDGRRYLDGVSSLWCNVHGHRVREIDDAIRAQLDKVAHTTMLGLSNEPATLLAQRLMRIVPPGLTKVFYSDSGATATEIAFKLAVQYWHNTGKPAKREFISLTGGYHGDTFGAISVGRIPAFHRPFLPLLFKVHQLPPETKGDANLKGRRKNKGKGDANLLVPLRRLLREQANRVAAIAMEPLVQGAAGMIVHPPGFLAEVRCLATRHDVLLICDEVATGFGRTGSMFACEQENVSPDLMCVGKGITGGYLPLAATFATQRIFDAFLGEPSEGRTFFHGHTYTGNPLACAAAIASLDLLQKNNVVRRVAAKSRGLAKMLAPLADLPCVGEIRQKGFMVGIELVQDKRTRRPFDPKRCVGAQICAAIRRRGVILRPLGDVIVLMPPLAMELPDLRTIVDAVRAELEEFARCNRP